MRATSSPSWGRSTASQDRPGLVSLTMMWAWLVPFPLNTCQSDITTNSKLESLIPGGVSIQSVEPKHILYLFLEWKVKSARGCQWVSSISPFKTFDMKTAGIGTDVIPCSFTPNVLEFQQNKENSYWQILFSYHQTAPSSIATPWIKVSTLSHRAWAGYD